MQINYPTYHINNVSYNLRCGVNAYAAIIPCGELTDDHLKNITCSIDMNIISELDLYRGSGKSTAKLIVANEALRDRKAVIITNNANHLQYKRNKIQTNNKLYIVNISINGIQRYLTDNLYHKLLLDHYYVCMRSYETLGVYAISKIVDNGINFVREYDHLIKNYSSQYIDELIESPVAFNIEVIHKLYDLHSSSLRGINFDQNTKLLFDMNWDYMFTNENPYK